MSLPRLTITYFEFGGRGEPSRLAAVIGKIPFTNKVIPVAEFGARKKDLPLGLLPTLEVEEDGKEKVIIAQSDAMLRYIAKLGGAGLYPEDPVEALKVDTMVDIISDWTKPIMVVYCGAVTSHVSETEWTDEERDAVVQRILTKVFPRFLGCIEQSIKDNGNQWIFGDKLTIADIKLYHWVPWLQSGGIAGFAPSCLDEYPAVVSIIDKINQIPEVQEYQKKHPMPYGEFDYEP